MKQKYSSAYEYDAHGHSRRYYHWRPGVLKYIKNTMYRRIRREARAVIAEGLREMDVVCKGCQGLLHDEGEYCWVCELP